MRRANTLGVISLTIVIALPGAAFAQSAKDLVGTWMLVTADAYGSNPKGTSFFDANGRRRVRNRWLDNKLG